MGKTKKGFFMLGTTKLRNSSAKNIMQRIMNNNFLAEMGKKLELHNTIVSWVILYEYTQVGTVVIGTFQKHQLIQFASKLLSIYKVQVCDPNHPNKKIKERKLIINLWFCIWRVKKQKNIYISMVI